jgi:hypothetical protein
VLLVLLYRCDANNLFITLTDALTDYVVLIDKAALCQFVMDAKVGNCDLATAAVTRYIEVHPMFEATRECKFLTQLLEAFRTDNVGMIHIH